MFSMADIFFFPTVAFLVRLGVQLQPRWPYVSSYYGMVSNILQLILGFIDHNLIASGFVWGKGEGGLARTL